MIPTPKTEDAAGLPAIRELLRRRAVEMSLIVDGETLHDETIDVLFERELTVPKASREDCERYYAAHPERFRRNEIVHASHILFAMTANTPLALLRRKAEAVLQEAVSDPGRFDSLARKWSNCPSSGVGGSLGQLLRGESVPEFERAVFDTTETGVLPRLVNTRFGFHIVCIDRRIAGEPIPFGDIEADIARFLDERVLAKAMQQYVSILASQAGIEGVGLGKASGPLVQ
jgi:peptidyl-prolyl cis-trans isomerase C